jgi:hypothetical protein
MTAPANSVAGAASPGSFRFAAFRDPSYGAPQPIRIASAVSVLALAVASCRAADESLPHYTTRDSAGVTIVDNEPVQEPLTLGSRIYRVGSVDGDDVLFQVRHVFLRGDGGVGVVEAGSERVRFYDARGVAGQALGGAGEGPGEFRGLWWAEPFVGDSLVAFDIAGAGSVSLFDPGGGFVRSFALPHVGRGEPVVRGGWPNGHVLVLMQSTSASTPIGEEAAWRLYSVSTDGSVARDFGSWPMFVNHGRLVIFNHRASFATAERHLLYTPGRRFEVQVIDTAGQVVRIARLRRQREPVSQADIDAYHAQVQARVARQPELAGALARRGDPVFADSMPAYVRVLAAGTRGFWALRAGAASDTAATWDVFDAAGVHLGPIVMPRSFLPTSVTDARVAGMAWDENDVEFVDVYAWAWPGD